jgi:hypothetical protein
LLILAKRRVNMITSKGKHHKNKKEEKLIDVTEQLRSFS